MSVLCAMLLCKCSCDGVYVDVCARVCACVWVYLSVVM